MIHILYHRRSPHRDPRCSQRKTPTGKESEEAGFGFGFGFGKEGARPQRWDFSVESQCKREQHENTMILLKPPIQDFGGLSLIFFTVIVWVCGVVSPLSRRDQWGVFFWNQFIFDDCDWHYFLCVANFRKLNESFLKRMIFLWNMFDETNLFNPIYFSMTKWISCNSVIPKLEECWNRPYIDLSYLFFDFPLPVEWLDVYDGVDPQSVWVKYPNSF